MIKLFNTTNCFKYFLNKKIILLKILISIFQIILLLIIGLKNPQYRIIKDKKFFGEKSYSSNESIFCQKANGISSLFYYLPALFAILLNRQHICYQEYFEYILFILSNIYNCIGNICFHMYCFKNGVDFDGSTMNVLISFVLAQTAKKIFFKLKFYYWNLVFWFVFIFIIILFNPFLFHLLDSETLYIYSIPITVFVELIWTNTLEKKRISNKFGILSFFFFNLGYISWNIQKKNYIHQHDESLFQWHSLWHFFTSLSIISLYKMYCVQNIFKYKI